VWGVRCRVCRAQRVRRVAGARKGVGCRVQGVGCRVEGGGRRCRV
jgi:hypothetical protein